MKNLKYIVSILAAFTLVASFSGCSDNDKSSSNNEVIYYDDNNEYVAPEKKDEIARENAAKIVGHLNEKLAVSECEVTAKNIVKVGEREPDENFTYSADQFAVQFEFINNSADIMTVSGAGDFLVSVDEGEEFMPADFAATSAAADSIEGFKSPAFDLETGQSDYGYITFEAKKGWKEIKITYTPFGMTGGVYDSVTYTITPDMVK